MAILGKVAGPMLKDNLLRNGTDLQIDTDLVYFDVVNRRVGIANTIPGNTLTVNGSFTTSNVYINNNNIKSLNSNLVLSAISGNIDVSNLRIGNLSTPIYNTDAVTKQYVDVAIATAEPNLTISDGTRTDNVGINYETLTFFGNTSQMNVYVTNNQVTFGFISVPTFYNNVNINGNAITNLVGYVLTNNQPYINSLGVLTSLSVTGNLSVNAISAGQIGNTNTILEGTLAGVSSSQPNITSLGTLVSLSVLGNTTTNALLASQIGNTNTILEGTIASVSSSQPNISSLGTLIGLTSTGTISAPSINAGTIGNAGAVHSGASMTLTGNISVNAVSAGQIGNTNTILEGTLVAASSSQPNITSTGTLVLLNVAGNITSANLITGNINSSYIISNANISAVNINATGDISAYNVNANVYTNSIVGQSPNGNVVITPTGIGIVNVNSKTALQVPSGNNGEYPTFLSAGMIRWNTSYNYLEVYTGTTWEAVGLEGTTVVTSDTFTGNGSQVDFILSQNNTTQGTLVSVNGVLQIPTTSYTVSGNVLTFAEAPISTDIIEARTYSPGSTVSGIRNDNSRFYIHTDSGLEKLTTIANSIIISESTQSNTAIFNTLNLSSGMAANVGNISVNNTTSAIDRFRPTLYRTAKYVISATNTTSNFYQATDAIVIHNGSTANITILGNAITNSQLFTLSANIYSGNVTLWATTTGNTNFKISNIYIPV
jgi:hypothetical protein